jgi:hexosaminidase
MPWQTCLNAAENGIKHGAIGYLNTDWGDRGHWQVLPVSYLGFAAGAAYSWSLETNRDIDLPAALSRHAFQDPSNVMGQFAYDLGNIYTASPVQIQNGTLMFWTLHWTHAKKSAAYPDASTEPYDRCLEALEEVAPLLGRDAMQRPDAELVRREFANTIRLMRHACRRGILAVDGRSCAGRIRPGARAQDRYAGDHYRVREIVAGTQPSRWTGGQRAIDESHTGRIRRLRLSLFSTR